MRGGADQHTHRAGGWSGGGGGGGGTRLRFLDAVDPCAHATHVRVDTVSAISGSGSGGGAAYDLRVPDALFDAVMIRAAKHSGYTARQHDWREKRSADLLLQEERAPLHDGTARAGGERVTRQSLLDASLIPRPASAVPQLLVRVLRRTAQPCYAFACDVGAPAAGGAGGVRECRVRCLALRVHARARLLLELVSMNSSGAGAAPDAPFKTYRRVAIEIDLRAPHGRGPALQAEVADLHRTVNNTIQVVLLGMEVTHQGPQGPQGPGIKRALCIFHPSFPFLPALPCLVQPLVRRRTVESYLGDGGDGGDGGDAVGRRP
jgi:hypothetical protein